jgi:hypothetical protein
MKERLKFAHYLPLKEAKYRKLLDDSPVLLKLKKIKLEKKYKYANYCSKLSEQMGCVTRFQIEDPDEEEWFIRTAHEEYNHYIGKISAMNRVLGCDKEQHESSVDKQDEQEKTDAQPEENADDY